MSGQVEVGDRVIVVWNGPAMGGACRSHVETIGCLWVETPSRLGPAAARNLGASVLLADADILVFTDSDDQVIDGWLDLLTEPLRSGDADVSGGALRMVRRGTSRDVLPEVDFWHCQALFGGNLAVASSAWLRLRGFDEALRCCEDTDLAWRAAAAQLRVVVVDGAIVEVRTKPPLRELVQRFRWGWWSSRLIEKHALGRANLPSLRDLVAHKKQRGYHRTLVTSVLGQWLGQTAARLLVDVRALRLDRRASRCP